MIILLLQLVMQMNSCLNMTDKEQQFYCIWDTTMEINAVLDEIEILYIK